MENRLVERLEARSGTGGRREARWFFRAEAEERPGCCPGSWTVQMGGRELRARIPGSARWGYLRGFREGYGLFLDGEGLAGGMAGASSGWTGSWLSVRVSCSGRGAAALGARLNVTFTGCG